MARSVVEPAGILAEHSPCVGPWINRAYTQDHALSAWPSAPCRGRHGSGTVRVGTRALRFAALRRADETVSMALILVVEDEAAVAEVIAETLIQRGHETRVAVSAAHAALIVKSERPDFILLDINLPDSAGTLLLGRLRQLRPDVPIIMLTANTDDELARATLRRGALDYIGKPFDLDHLVQVIEAALAS